MRDRPISWAPYMTWAKHHPPARYDLRGSNLLPCTLDDLPGAREALEVNGRNEDGYVPLVEAIAERFGTHPERVAQAPGASGANFLALAALVRPGDTVLVEWPGYDPHAGAARFLDCEVTTFKRSFEDGFAVDPGRVEAALTPTTRAVVVTNLHNPSGAFSSPEALDQVALVAESVGARVIVDEVYRDSLFGSATEPAATRSDTFISTNSLTKSYGLSGLRCGWMIAAPDLVERALRVRDVMDAVGSYPSDVLSLVAFRQLDRLLARARSILEPNMASLRAFMDGRPELSWLEPPGGAVAFPRLNELDDAGPFVKWALEEWGVGVVPGSFFGMPRHFRIAVGGEHSTLEKGLEAFGRALDHRDLW